MKSTIIFIVTSIFYLFFSPILSAEFPEFTVTQLSNPEPGYLFMGPIGNNEFGLYDHSGKVAYKHRYAQVDDGLTDFKMLSNGNYVGVSLFYNGWLMFDSNFNLVDSLKIDFPLMMDFHDIIITPQNHFLVIAIDTARINMRQYIPDGNPNALVWGFSILEYDQNKNLVWRWCALDHMSPMDATDDAELNQPNVFPFHPNSLSLDNDGNVLVSCRQTDEITKINRATGEIIWRMGGTKCRNNQFTFINDTYQNFIGFSHQHNVQKLPNGNIILFDNGNLKPIQYSRAVEYSVDETNKTLTKVWEFRHSPDVFSSFMGNVQRLPMGNTLIGWGGQGAGTTVFKILTEVTDDGNTVLEFEQANTVIYRAFKFFTKMQAVTKSNVGTGLYSFNETNNNTNLYLNLTSISGSGEIWAEKHSYSPHSLTFEDTEPCYILEKRWVIRSKSLQNLSGGVKISVNEIDTQVNPSLCTIQFRSTENVNDFREITTTYNSSSNTFDCNYQGNGEYIITSNLGNIPEPDQPANHSKGQNISLRLQWKSNSTTVQYQLQVSRNQEFTNLVMDTSGLTVNNFLVENLNYKTIYYWRVKQFNVSCGMKWSNVFNFTTRSLPPVLVLPANNSKDQPLTVTLQWQGITGASGYKVEVSEFADFSTSIYNEEIPANISVNISDLKSYTDYFWRVAVNYNGSFSIWSNVFRFKTIISPVVLNTPSNNSSGIRVSGELVWLQTNGATNYTFEMATDSIFYNDYNEYSGLDTNNLSYSNLKHSTEYFWRVKALATDSKGEWSKIWKFYTMIDTVSLKLPLNSAGKAPVTGNLTWEPLANAIEYDVQLSDKSDFSNLILSSKLKLIAVEYRNLKFETNYYWRVRGYDKYSAGDWSETRTFTTQPELFITQPYLIYPQNELSKVPLTFDLSWLPVFNAQNYHLIIATDDKFKNIYFEEEQLADTSYRLNLGYNEKYYWKVRAYRTNLTGEWSDTYNFTTKLKSPSLIYPVPEEIVAPEMIEFSWDLIPGADFYDFEIANDELFKEIILDKDNLNTNRYLSTELKSLKQYYWRVSGFSQNNSSDWSEVRLFRTKDYVGVEENILNNSDLVFPNPANDYIQINHEKLNCSVINFELIDLLGNKILNHINSDTEGNLIINLMNLNSGLYQYRIISGCYTYIGKLIISK